uniref:Uncharacterized protein n=1 Tax=Arundo donax TaxID=35708 RepID=A0A0A8XYY4_ARUDO
MGMQMFLNQSGVTSRWVPWTLTLFAFGPSVATLTGRSQMHFWMSLSSRKKC